MDEDKQQAEKQPGESSEQGAGQGGEEKPRPDRPREDNTISLLDLMNEHGQSDAAFEAYSDETPTPAPLVSGFSPATPDDEATPTGGAIPIRIHESDAPPLPLTADDLTPTEPPLVVDEEATQVQPRSAFPGQTQIEMPSELNQRPPVSELPTQPPQPIPKNQPSPTSSRLPLPQNPPLRESQGVTASAATAAAAAATRPQARQRPVRAKTKGKGSGCLLRLAIIGIIVFFVGLALAVAATSLGYVLIARQLPPSSELRTRASTFETAQILDREGGLLYSLEDPNAGNRNYVPLSQISQELQNATIATEDSRFYTNPGFDPAAIARAILRAAQEGEGVYGTSTITQQLARALLLDEEERTQRTFSRKVKEIILAAEIFRTYEKDEILELYLNEINYGNRAYGIEAAAKTYFNKPAADLNLAEASLLAGLPQAPAFWDPFTSPEDALGRQQVVLGLMVDSGFITPAESQAAMDASAPVVRAMEPPDITIRHPHFTVTVLQQLEAEIGAQAIYRGGLRVFTTLDPAAQVLAEQTIAANRVLVNAAGANNAAMVVIHPQTGEVLALVGSVDFNDEAISGQVNMALSPRQPGSSIKPLVYLSSMEQGWTPSTLIWDVETQFPDGANPPYVPKNYDDEFHGPQRLRPALGNSYNIPAVKALEFVGVCEFINNVQKVGLTSLQDSGCAETGQPREHGLSLALGGGEISPLDMAGAYAVLANGGHYLPPFTISRIEDRNGQVIFENQPSPSADNQVIRPEHAYLLSDILSDNGARQPEFSADNLLTIDSHRVAAKTGTSGAQRNDVRDGWTIGYTPEVVTAVWVGNTDNEAVLSGQSGYRMATPIWNAYMSQYLSGRQPIDFNRPPGITQTEICADSGTQPGPGCTRRITELFANNQLPKNSDQDFLRTVFIDLWTNLVANRFCTESVQEAKFFNPTVNSRADVLAREQQNAKNWLEQTAAGQAWAVQRGVSLPLRLPPTGECDQNTPRPQAIITQPGFSTEIAGEIEIIGTALGPNYSGYLLHYGLTHDPQGWGSIQEQQTNPVDNGLLARWNTEGIPGGPITIRLIVFGPDNPYTIEVDPISVEARVPVFMLEPTPTPSPTPTETPTPTSTSTATPTATGTPTPTTTDEPGAEPSPTVTPTASQTPPATFTPTITPTETPTGTPTETPASTPIPP